MREFTAITKALADKTRLRIIMALCAQDLCVCQVTELLQLAPSTVSKHMQILNQAGLIESRKKGRWVFYGLIGNGGRTEARLALNWIRNSLKKNPEIEKDSKRLKRILKVKPEILCRKQLER